MIRWDRWWLNVFAAAFMATGALLVGARLVVPASRTVVGRPLAGWVGRPWFPWAVAATGVIVVVCGAAWLVRRLRGTRHLITALGVPKGPADAPVTVTSRWSGKVVTASTSSSTSTRRSRRRYGTPPGRVQVHLPGDGLLVQVVSELEAEVGPRLRCPRHWLALPRWR